MHLKNQPPVFVPDHYQAEIETLSKAALMDMVWDLATRCAAVDEFQVPAIMEEIRSTRAIILDYRKREKKQGAA